jgi:hypothetical protein
MTATDDPTGPYRPTAGLHTGDPHPDHPGSTRPQSPSEPGRGMAPYAGLLGGEADGRARTMEDGY